MGRHGRRQGGRIGGGMVVVAGRWGTGGRWLVVGVAGRRLGTRSLLLPETIQTPPVLPKVPCLSDTYNITVEMNKE